MIAEKVMVGKKYPLDGLLTLPDAGTSPYPAVVLVQGSGATDMDEKIKKITPFKDIAEGLANLGVASIRYNKRSYTYGKQMVKELGKSLSVKEETIEDAIFAADILRQDDRINPDKIFIVGHSLGGMLTPRIDAEGGNFAGLIIMAGSPRRLEEIMKEQQDDFLKKSKGLMKWIAKKQIKKISAKLDNIQALTDDEAKNIPFAGNTSLYYLKDAGNRTAEDFLNESAKPVLVMHPEKDVQVSFEKDFGKFKEILANRPNATFKLYAGLNHAFVPSLYGDISKVMKEFNVAQNVDKTVIADMADWIKNR